MKDTKKVMLLILDGWGLGADPKVDAIQQASTPFFDHLMQTYPNSTLITHGEAVGLPDGQMGNSEVGHLNIGAGRVVYQELARIHKAIRDRELHQNPTLLDALAYAKKNNKPVHLMGLVSDGGVHAHIDHVKALCDITHDQGIEQVYIHAFTDGRDCDPKSGLGFLQDLQQYIADQPAKIASVIGRYYAMDRDKRWERIQQAYALLVHGTGEVVVDLSQSIQQRYDHGETDEFLKPMVLVDESGKPRATLQDDDVLICFNFRTDRPREISTVLTQQDMPEYHMTKLNLRYLTMTRYDDTFEGIEVLFHKEDIQETLGEVLAEAGKTQVRIAETEKYPHVTFFFNGGREQAFPGERRILIDSPKVATYDLQPEMSAFAVTEAIVADIQANQPDFICLNYANADMVGHTGVFKAAIKAAETVDTCLKTLVETGLEHGYQAIIIADHGNSDYLINPDGSPNTAHSKNPVPFLYVNPEKTGLHVRDGKLADIAPTILHIMGLPIPPSMTGSVLVKF